MRYSDAVLCSAISQKEGGIQLQQFHVANFVINDKCAIFNNNEPVVNQSDFLKKQRLPGTVYQQEKGFSLIVSERNIKVFTNRMMMWLLFVLYRIVNPRTFYHIPKNSLAYFRRNFTRSIFIFDEFKELKLVVLGASTFYFYDQYRAYGGKSTEGGNDQSPPTITTYRVELSLGCNAMIHSLCQITAERHGIRFVKNTHGLVIQFPRHVICQSQWQDMIIGPGYS